MTAPAFLSPADLTPVARPTLAQALDLLDAASSLLLAVEAHGSREARAQQRALSQVESARRALFEVAGVRR